MECTGILKSITKDWMSNKYLMTFEINEDISHDSIEEIRVCEKLSLVFKKWRKKRSLDSNSYYCTLLTKLATKIDTSNSELHNQLLAEYGYPELIGDMLVRTPIPDTEEAEEMVMDLDIDTEWNGNSVFVRDDNATLCADGMPRDIEIELIDGEEEEED